MTRATSSLVLLALWFGVSDIGNAQPVPSFIDQLLSTEPNSTIGWQLRGRLAAQAGRCADAAAAYQRASDIVTGALDPRNTGLPTASPEQRRRLVEFLRDELRRHDCPLP